MHTNIAFSLFDKINDRKINEYFDLEDSIVTASSYTKANLLDLITSEKGTKEDKMRLFLVYYIIHNIPPEDLAEFEHVLQNVGADMKALEYLKRRKQFDDAWAITPIASRDGTLGTFEDSIRKAKKGFVNFLSNMVAPLAKYIPRTKDYYLTRIVDAVMNLKESKLGVDNYLYFDPKFPINSTPKKTTPFKEAIVFVIGGGNYVEYQNLKEYCQKSLEKGPLQEKKIIYGSTEIITGESFLQQLGSLSDL